MIPRGMPPEFDYGAFYICVGIIVVGVLFIGWCFLGQPL